jgi:hypothetical protein
MNKELTLLKTLIREELDRLVRSTSGFSGVAGVGGRGRGSAELTPPGLGNEDQQEEDQYGKEQEKSQFSVRVDSRRNGKTRQD